MTKQTEKAYRRWRRLAEKGYGRKTNIADLRLIDARIRDAKDRYERLLAAEKGKRA